MKTQLADVDRRIAGFMSRTGSGALRLSLAVIFIWFGILKVFGVSPAEPLLRQTVQWLPMLPPDLWVPVIGWWEVAIGVTFLFPVTVRIAIALLAGQMVGTFLPLVALPEVTFRPGGAPYVPTMEGQYILKNLLIISAALVVGGAVKVRSRSDAEAGTATDGGGGVTVAGLICLLLAGCASTGPRADMEPEPGPDDAPTTTAVSFVDRFAETVGATPAESARSLGDALSTSHEPIENRHVPGQIDTLSTYRHPGVEVTYYRITGGRDLLFRVRATRDGFPGGTPFDVGSEARRVIETMGEPNARTAEGWRYEEDLAILLLLMRDSRVYSVTYLPYVD